MLHAGNNGTSQRCPSGRASDPADSLRLVNGDPFTLDGPQRDGVIDVFERVRFHATKANGGRAP